MDFGLTEEQQLLKTSARAFLERECTGGHVRAMEDDETGYSPDLWRAMGGLGWHGIMLPEEHGGAGLSFLELALLVEEMGRVLLPGPFIVNALCGALLAMSGTPDQRMRLLPAIAGGETINSYAYLEPHGKWGLDAIETAAIERDGRFTIDGRKAFVAHANSVDAIQVWARTRGGLGVLFVSPEQAGVALTRLETVGRDSQFEVAFSGVEVAAADVLEIRPADAARWRNMAMVLECAYLLGLAERDMELTVGYAKERRQFGQPIGAFQAVQHRAANMRIDVDGMRVAAYRAAWSVSRGDAAQDRDTALAKAFCSDASRRVVGSAQQIHGGIGFTRDYPAQLYFRRQKRGELAWGDAAFHHANLATMVAGKA